MPNIESGVTKYITVKTEVKWHIPVDIKGNVLGHCDTCPFYSISANRCNLTRDYCVMPTKYVNGTCPFLDQMPDVLDVSGAEEETELPFIMN